MSNYLFIPAPARARLWSFHWSNGGGDEPLLGWLIGLDPDLGVEDQDGYGLPVVLDKKSRAVHVPLSFLEFCSEVHVMVPAADDTQSEMDYSFESWHERAASQYERIAANRREDILNDPKFQARQPYRIRDDAYEYGAADTLVAQGLAKWSTDAQVEIVSTGQALP